MATELPLFDVPAALAVFYHDNTSQVRIFAEARGLLTACAPVRARQIPSVAVAVGPYIVLYRNLMAYFKFELPSLPVGVRSTHPAGHLRMSHPRARSRWRRRRGRACGRAHSAWTAASRR